MEIDNDKLDELVLALLHLNSWTEKIDRDSNIKRAWKSLDWDTLDRLFEKELIYDPKSKAKSVTLTDEGAAEAARMFAKHLAKGSGDEQ